jgi:hypothetical protein|nr:MAG TPA: hypothetical protein [Caudoviricetes sp.]
MKFIDDIKFATEELKLKFRTSRMKEDEYFRCDKIPYSFQFPGTKYLGLPGIYKILKTVGPFLYKWKGKVFHVRCPGVDYIEISYNKGNLSNGVLCQMLVSFIYQYKEFPEHLDRRIYEELIDTLFGKIIKNDNALSLLALHKAIYEEYNKIKDEKMRVVFQTSMETYIGIFEEFDIPLIYTVVLPIYQRLLNPTRFNQIKNILDKAFYHHYKRKDLMKDRTEVVQTINELNIHKRYPLPE